MSGASTGVGSAVLLYDVGHALFFRGGIASVIGVLLILGGIPATIFSGKKTKIIDIEEQLLLV